MSKIKDYIYDREYEIARHKKFLLAALVLILMAASFILGAYTCAKYYYEFPLWAPVYFDGYHGRPLYGHYGEFLELFRIKE